MEENEGKDSKMLLVSIPKDVHRVIKSQAAWMNMTLRQYVLQAILKKIEEDKKYL